MNGVAIPLPGDLENRVLRRAVQENLVSFPSQVPGLGKQSRPDFQQRIVVLYFVCGWTMDDIARRYGLGRQRIGQILTDWRIRAVKEGYIQELEPEHPIFARVGSAEKNEVENAPVQAQPQVVKPAIMAPIAVSDADVAPLAIRSVPELKGLNPAEQLHAIVGILDNQLRLCSTPLRAGIDSCEPLLARAKTLCARLEAQASATRDSDEGRITAVIAAANELFQRASQGVAASV